MRPQLMASAAVQGGVITRAQALPAGYSDKELRLLVRRREWVRVRHGAYTLASVWSAADDRQQHVLRLRAAMLAVRNGSVASHDSAAVVHVLPTYGLDLSEVMLTRPLGRTSRKDAKVNHHLAELPDEQVVVINSIHTTALARTALDVARARGFEAGVVAADAALHAGASRAALDAAAALMAQWPGGTHSTAVSAVADGRTESVGESLTRLIVLAMGLAVTPQVVLAESARVDLLLDDHPVVIEFDGKVKYVDENGRPNPRVLWDEKNREDRIRDLAYEVVRVTWSGLFGAGRIDTERRIRAAIRRAELRRVPAA